MKIFDCFNYNGEKSILELRAKVLAPYVDVFIVVYSVETFTGNAKDLSYASLRKDLDAVFGEKYYLISPNTSPPSFSSWDREFYQMNCMGKYYSPMNRTLPPARYFFCSDVDEIWNPSMLNLIIDKCNESRGFYPLCFNNFQFLVNYQCTYGRENSIGGPYVVRSRSVYSLLSRWTLRKLSQMQPKTIARPEDVLGWHFSFLGMNPEAIRSKAESYGHQESDVQNALANADPVSLIEQGLSIFHQLRPGETWELVNPSIIGLPGHVDLNALRNDRSICLDTRRTPSHLAYPFSTDRVLGKFPFRFVLRCEIKLRLFSLRVKLHFLASLIRAVCSH